MSNATTMTYGAYEFSPVPLISISRSTNQAGNRDNPFGYTFTMTLNGTLTTLPNGAGGLLANENLTKELRDAFDKDGLLLEIKCDVNTVMQLYPRVLDVQFDESNNNWTQTIPFSIQLEYDTDEQDDHPDGRSAFIDSYSEDWSVEFANDEKYYEWDLSSLTNQEAGHDYASDDSNNPFEARVTHTLSVTGKQSWSGPLTTGTPGTAINAADNAMAWITGVYDQGGSGLGYDATEYGHALGGWTNLAGASGFSEYDHYRTHTINETDGSVTLTESWLILGDNVGLSGANRKVTETFSVSTRESLENGQISMSIEGEIRGLEEMDYTTTDQLTASSGHAYDNAALGWSEIQLRVFPRAQFIYQQDFSRQLNPDSASKNIAHQPSRGIITYSYEFDDRPCNFITGALTETFSINDNNPADVFASLPVLGRAQGPVLQSIDTVTSPTRDVTIEAVMQPPTGCGSISDLNLNKPTDNVENLLCEFETELTTANNQVFKSSDNESWEPKSGRYSRSVQWTYANCTGDISTSFCD